MVEALILCLVYGGSALMVYNIYGFSQFAMRMRSIEHWGNDYRMLYLPIVLLALFLAGYLAVGVLGSPDLIVGGILFGGSVFVFIMYHLLNYITDNVIRAEQLEAELMAAEKSNKAKSDFLASMSHEMRTPLNVIMGLDEVAQRNKDLPVETHNQLKKIGLAARHLLSLINGMLDMNNIEEHRLNLVSEPFCLRDTIDELDAIAQTLCEEKDLTYEISVSSAVFPNCMGDETRLRQVLQGILHNAVKYTDAPGNVRFCVDVGARDDVTQTVRFTVSDTGIGMDESFVPKVFSKFAQEDAGFTSRFSGSGLSLAIAHGLIEKMGGTIAVQSTKGEGSTFVVEVPLLLVDGLEEAPQQAGETSAQAGDVPVVYAGDAHANVDGPARGVESLEGRRVLVVEDIPENAEIVEDLLDLEGALSEHASNGQIALDMFAASKPYWYDAVLMDLRMPVMDGFEATRRIRALDREDAQLVPIVALTANAFETEVRESFAAGMDAHLSKPADVDLLYKTLEKLILV